MNDAAGRRRERANWHMQVFRNDHAAEEAADARFWLSMSPLERVSLAWTLSLEMHALAHPDAPTVRPGLSRSVVRIVRS
jgi:hypothetical protein